MTVIQRDQDLRLGGKRDETAARGGPNSLRWRWLAVFGVGLALWIAAAVTTELTQNPNLIPTVVLLGSFLVPVTAVVWNFDHEADSGLSAQRVLYAFVVGGVLGVLGASLLEGWLVQDSVLTYVGVGFVEELVKLAALVTMSWGLTRYTTRDGIVLGAAVGFGFAALESSGYTLSALFTSGGASLSALIGTQVMRGELSPLGHGLWGAILGGVLFHTASRAGRLGLTWGLAAAFVLNSVLHALWDSMRGIALVITMLSATPQQLQLIELGTVPQPQGAQLGLFLFIQFGGMAVVATIGIGALLVVWLRWGVRTPGQGLILEVEQPLPAVPSPTRPDRRRTTVVAASAPHAPAADGRYIKWSLGRRAPRTDASPARAPFTRPSQCGDTIQREHGTKLSGGKPR